MSNDNHNAPETVELTAEEVSEQRKIRREKLQELRFMIWRIEMGHEDIYVLRDMLQKNLISMENLGMIIASITTQPKGLYEKIGFVLK